MTADDLSAPLGQDANKKRRFAPAVMTDDLTAPLGLDANKKRRFALAVWVPHVIAGALGLCLLVFAGWVVFANAPFGGEPMAIVSADPHEQAPSAQPGEPASRPKVATTEPSAPEKSAPAGGQTVTVIDRKSGKRWEVPIVAGDATTPSALVSAAIASAEAGATLPSTRRPAERRSHRQP